MTVPVTDPDDTDAGVAQVGADAVSRKGFSRSFSNEDASSASVSTYIGPADQAEAYYEEKRFEAAVAGAKLDVEGAVGRVEVEFKTDKGTGDDPDEPEDPQPEDESDAVWNTGSVEILRPLAAHPYFQLDYDPGAGYTIEQEIAKADIALASGQPYVADASYGARVQRYYSLRAAGVSQYPALGMQLTKSYVTAAPATITASGTGVGQVIALGNINPPIQVLLMLEALEKITGYATDDPATAVLQGNPIQWEWVKRPTILNMGGNQNKVNVDITESWWGIDRWSTVIYPGGTWDPPQPWGA